MPMGEFKNFDECVKKMQGRKNPRTGKRYTAKQARAYCGGIKKRVER